MSPERTINAGREVDRAEFFRALADVLPGVVYQSRISADGTAKVEYVNDAARWLLECEPEAIMRDVGVFRDLIHPDDREMFNRRLKEHAATGGAWKIEYRVLLPSGRVCWLSSQASVTALPDGGSLWRGFFTDVTAQKTAAAVQELSSGMLARTQRVAGLGTWSVDFGPGGASDEAGGRLWWSDETFRLLGFEPGSVTPTADLFFELVHPEDRSRVRFTSDSALSAGRDYSVEFRATLPNGSTRYFSEAVELLPAANGHPAGILGTLLDITERKRAENDLEVERERLVLATRAGHVGTWDYDVRTQAIRWNEVMYDIHGVRPGEYEPSAAENYKFLTPEDQARVKAAFEQCLASGSDRYSMDVNLVLRDGQRRPTRSHALILRDPAGEPVRVVGIEMDITEARRAEEAMTAAKEAAEAADRAKSEFLATMSHEIRTPMNGVLGYTSLLKETPLAADQREYLEIIESSGEHLLAIINDILDVSRIEAGGLQIEVEAFDLRACVREVFEMLRPVAEIKQLAYRCGIDAAVPAGLVTDRGRLAQVLTNVLGNAIKFTDAGEVRLDISAHPHEAGGRWRWEFRVSDTGPGIAPGALAHIFSPFYQVDSSSRRKHGGTGLGLTISRRLAELLNGSLTAENRANGGSSFVLVLDAEVVEEISNPGPDPESAPALGEMHVLVVEDNPVNRRLCELQLERIGCTAEFALSGLEALESFGSGRFDVVLMDMQLPGLDGCEATREIRRLEQAQNAKRTPIIGMTANALTEDRQRCFDSGMDDYLSKPLRQEVLAAMLEKWAPA